MPMLAVIDHCQTADDVRNAARAVYERRRQQEQRLRAERLRKQMLADASQYQPPPPAPVPAPPPAPAPSRARLSEAEFAELIKEQQDRVRDILFDLEAGGLRAPPRIKEIQVAVCKEFNVTIVDLNGPYRSRNVTVPRQVSMMLCRSLNGSSTPRIGLAHGGRDHTTVLHAISKLAWLREQLQAELSVTEDPVDLWAARAAQLICGKAD